MKRLGSFLNFLIFTLVVIIGGAFYYLKPNSGAQTSRDLQPLSAQQVDDIVNTHIKDTVQESKYTKFLNDKTIRETYKKLAELEKQKKINQDKEIAKIPIERQIWKEDQKVSDVTPEQVIGGAINEGLEQEKMDEAEKKEYARQWIQNAREAGYLLELSPELEVIKYTPIRKPSQQDDSVKSDPSE